MKPIILITSSLAEEERFLRLNRAYAKAVDRAGGTALIPDYCQSRDISAILEVCGGVLLSGGGDIEPYYFGESPVREIGEISPMRDEYEIELACRAVEKGKPTLAICRGAQVLNVALGGKVWQDIYSMIKKPLIKHSQESPRCYPSHSVIISEGSRLKGIIKKRELRVNSFHHQAVSELGSGLCVSAVSEDGITEAIEHTERDFCIGVQWHPEHMTDEEEHFSIFREFVKRASEQSAR